MDDALVYNGHRVLCLEALAGTPRMQLLYPDSYSPAFRDSTNEWMAGFFGRGPELAYTAYHPRHGATLFVGPQTYAELAALVSAG